MSEQTLSWRAGVGIELKSPANLRPEKAIERMEEEEEDEEEEEEEKTLSQRRAASWTRSVTECKKVKQNYIFV
jgi:hypothetical protein